MTRRNPWDNPKDRATMVGGIKRAAKKRASKKALMPEDALQMHVVKLLQAYGRDDIEWHCVPNGEKRDPRTARRLKLLGVQPGVGDLMFLIDGQSIALELKTEIGTQSQDQQDYQERHERAGGFYFVAFGLDQALGVLKGINAFRPNISFANAFDGRGVRRGSELRIGSPNQSSETEVPA